jgi:hypothetical protein
MLDDLYLMAVVAKHRVEEWPESTPERVRRQIASALRLWGGRFLEGVKVAGSYAKGTAIRGATLAPKDVDVDLFLSLSPEAPEALAEYQESLVRKLREYQPRIGNVSVKILFENRKVDLTVGRRTAEGDYHVLWQRERATWLRTNVERQIRHVRQSGRIDEILATKIWRRTQGLYFPSFYLELAVIEALGAEHVPFHKRFLRVLEWLAERMPTAVLRDPANQSNIISELLPVEEKWRVANAAWQSVRAESWTEVV